MHPERVVIAKVSAVVVAAVVVTIIAAIVVATIVGAFGSLLLGHLFPIVQIIVFPFGSRPRARAMIIGIVTPP
jgi:Na+(H+)/acetate symporter ActP